VERAVVLASGARLEIPEELLREGRRVGGYTLERELGAGAMGEVWLAKHALLARPSAVKLIRQDTLRANASAREQLETRFQREAQATARLRSPHTVELYDFGVTDEGDFYYVMEYLSGIDLGSLVKKFGALPSARAAHLLGQAAMSLGEAHLAGLVHRDVKPANLLACQLGPHYDFLKLLDFGIVRNTTDENETVMSVLELPGTPNSLSPEVIDGQPATFASDIYGLGCVAYWLLAGQHPFEAPSLSALLKKHTAEIPTAPSKLTSGVSSELEDLVMRCLAKSPADRPSDAFEIHRALAAMPLRDRWDNQIARVWWNENLVGLMGDDELADRTTTGAYADTVVMTSENTGA
jgi:serine/threonine protein kinase